MYRTSDNTEKSFKCSKCGMMFTNTSADKAECPFCHHHCRPGECEMLGSSNEGY